MGLYAFYERKVVPHVLDLVMRPLARYRSPTLARAFGKVLEVGFGTGLNLPLYPPSVAELTAVDPMVTVTGALRRRLDAARFPVRRYALPVESGLPFEPHTFDCAVSTWTFCTVCDPGAGMREIARVLRPQAPLFFAEHGRSNNPATARWQDRLNGMWGAIACGCHLNRAIDAMIEANGFRIERLQRLDAPGVPRTHGHLYLGAATAPG
jgi:SAM-dependent methyltransferase